MELGCFLAGALMSSQGHMVTEEVVSYIEPIRDFLAIIFFASIGECLCVTCSPPVHSCHPPLERASPMAETCKQGSFSACSSLAGALLGWRCWTWAI